jgi:hypothetical protein
MHIRKWEKKEMPRNIEAREGSSEMRIELEA